jgi:deoxyribodipyrimidine photo-lyase
MDAIPNRTPESGGPGADEPCRVTLSVVWFKRDLRTTDHEPLVRAGEHARSTGGGVLCLYVYERAVLDAPEHDPAHLVFVNECLAELRARLRRLGNDLVLIEGEMPGVLDRLHAKWRIDRLFSHEETGLSRTFDRDRRVASWCRKSGVRWIEVPQHGVFRPLESRDGWAARWNRRMRTHPVGEPRDIPAPPDAIRRAIDPGPIRDPQELGLPPSARTGVQAGGMTEGWARLGSFLDDRGRDYQREMSNPLGGADACSRISPHLAYGSLSVREAYHASRDRLEELGSMTTPDAVRWRRSVSSFDRRLRWHCHFIQKLEDEPAIEWRNFNRAYDGVRTEDDRAWTDEERRRFEAWASGRTGYPFIDACMRSLLATGWINFRMRAMLVSFAAYHLRLHWKRPAIHLARCFVDFEPGIHYPQCQMQSGTTGINTVRIYSPIKQGIDQDPRGVFIRRWVPEIADLPDEHIHRPERTPELTQRLARCVIGEAYPEPIVDHERSYNEAKRMIFRIRSTDQARVESARVYHKHGSRRRPTDRR